tara:strand:- start:358 stop:501 length:144 start_codon:yes stop_codon:yes gene_type:complete
LVLEDQLQEQLLQVVDQEFKVQHQLFQQSLQQVVVVVDQDLITPDQE